jgi:hypothetical protein
MSSLFGTDLRGSEKIRKKLGGEMSSPRHEQAYHVAHGCQAASLSLTTVSDVVFSGHAKLKAQKMQDFWLLLSVISTSWGC